MFQCPNCDGNRFKIRFPALKQEPRWYAICETCQRRYELMPDGQIQAILESGDMKEISKQEVLEFLRVRIIKGNHFLEGPTGGLMVAVPVEKMVEWFMELLKGEKA